MKSLFHRISERTEWDTIPDANCEVLCKVHSGSLSSRLEGCETPQLTVF